MQWIDDILKYKKEIEDKPNNIIYKKKKPL